MILGPMLQVGWARASLDGDRRRGRRAVRPRNGPPLAVSTSRATRAGLSVARRHWWMAPCSLSTGTSSAPGVRRARCTTGPAAISDSLLASARRRPASRVARVTDRPAKPTTPLTTTSASVARLAMASAPPRTSHSGSGLGHHGGGGLVGDGHDLGPVGAGLGDEHLEVAPGGAEGGQLEAVGLGREHVERLGADRAGGPGEGDPERGHGVEPTGPARPRAGRRDGVRHRPDATGRSAAQPMRPRTRSDVVGGRQDEEHAVEAVEHAAVPGQDRAHVLEAEVALEQRLGQVAERGDQGAEQAEHQRLTGAEGADVRAGRRR